MTSHLSALLLGICLLTACSKEEEIVETQPAYQTMSTVAFTKYDDQFTLNLPSNTGVKEASDFKVVLYPDVEDLTHTVEVNYIQGNSLQDYGEAFYDGLTATPKSEYSEDGYQAGDYFYVFKKSENNVYLRMKGGIQDMEYCKELMNGVT